LGEKAFAIENELPPAVNVSVAVPPVPLLALTLPVVLVYPVAVSMPWCCTSTLTENVQEPLAGMVPPLKLTELLPAVAVIVPAPQDPVRLLGVWTKRLTGKVSVKATAVIGLPDGLVMVKVKIEVCPMATPDGLNDFAMVGGCANNAPDITSNVKKTATGAANQRPHPLRNDLTIIFCPFVLDYAVSSERLALLTKYPRH
jgi:hypothetical protein